MVKLRHIDDEVANYMSDCIIDKSGFIKIIEIETGYISYQAPFMFHLAFEIVL